MLSAKLQEMEDEDLKEVEDEMTEAKKEYKDDDRKDGGESKETKRTEKMKYGKDLAEAEDMDEEMDLDEILAELEGDLSEDARTDAEEEGYKDGMEDEKEDMEDDEEDEDIDLEEMSEDDLKSFIEDVIADMIEAGELEAGEEFEVEDEDVEDEDIDIDVEDEEEEITEAKEEMDEAKEEMVDEVVDIDSIVDKMGSAGKETVKKLIDALGKAIDYTPIPAGTTGKLEEEDDEMMKEMESLRAELHEVNLLNAKLLYTNKIFRAKLTRSSKG